MAELEVIEKIRSVLINDATIKGYVKDRVYAEHISSVNSPIYPAISLHLMPGQARNNVPDMINMLIQIDLWFSRDKATIEDVLTCYQRIRALLHRQNLYDAVLGAFIQQIFESGIGPMMFDADANCHHLPVRYNVVTL